MPEPQRLPRKYLSQLLQVQEELRLLGQKAQLAHDRLSSSYHHCDSIEASIRDIESMAYRLALELAELKTADDCTGCPLAPSSVPAQVHLLVLADELERQALLARRRAQEAPTCGDSNRCQPFHEHLLFFGDVDVRNAKK